MLIKNAIRRKVKTQTNPIFESMGKDRIWVEKIQVDKPPKMLAKNMGLIAANNCLKFD
jgi:hypothetical protein